MAIGWMVILVLGAGAPPKTVCVNAEVVDVRVLASDGEDVVARLRIGTRVLLGERRGEWSRIEAGDARGWMKTELLSDDCVPLKTLVTRSKTAATPADAVHWANRALALDPFAPEAQEAAVAAYEKAEIAGDMALALQELREGKTPVLFASCRDGEAILVAQAMPAGLEGLLTTSDLLPPPSDLETLLPALAGMTWFALAPDGGTIRYEGTPFPAPRILVSEGSDSIAHVRLGACSAPGTLYATRALTAVPSTPLVEESAARARSAFAGASEATAPTRFSAELFAGEDVREQGFGTVTIERSPGASDAPVVSWALLEGTAIAENVNHVTHATVAALGDGRRVAVVAHENIERASEASEEAEPDGRPKADRGRIDRSAGGAGRRFTVIVVQSDRTREKLELALEWGPAPE